MGLLDFIFKKNKKQYYKESTTDNSSTFSSFYNKHNALRLIICLNKYFKMV